MIPTGSPERLSLSAAERVLAAQPFSEIVGATLERFDVGEAVLKLTIADHHLQQFGLVHGGVLAYLVDNSLTFACGTVLGASLLTSGINVTYLASAREGILRAAATVTARDGRRAVATVTIDNIAPDGAVRPCAVGQGTAVAMGEAS